MKDKKEIHIREFIFTDEEVANMREEIERQSKNESDPSMNFKRNVVKKSIEKKYRNIMTGNSMGSDVDINSGMKDSNPGSSAFLRIINIP